MEELSVMGCSQFNVELKTLVDALLRDVCALAARWSAALQQQISASHSENQELRRRLHLLEETLSHRTRRESVAHPDTLDQLPEPDCDLAAPGSYLHCKEIRAKCAKNTNMETERTDIKAGQWRRIKEEEVEISVTGRAVHRLDASHIDELHTTTDAEENCQLSELKTEIEGSVEPEIQEPESERNVDDSEDDAQDCLVVDEECDAEDGHGHLSPPKTEEEDGERDEEQEQFGTLPLLISDLQHNSIPLPNNSTSSDCSMFVMLEGNTNVSTTDLNDQYSDLAGRASGPSNSKKQKGPRYICNICGKSLSSKYSLTVHFTMHTGDRPYACTQCGKRFVNRTNLQIHQNIHTGAKPYVCTLCPKSFADPSPFGRHMRMHSRELQQSIHSPKCQFICNICGKSLSTKQGLSYHITMHTGERPYTCTWCGKSFVQKHNLKIHQNIHTGAKPYACTLCPKSFADPSSLKKHKRMHV
ncbi:zinc finger protein 436-like isoform X1 [Pygocentrus nattereri]|uniref:C2H2-type domain-containing protein n=1 Tax=Pygocentrus nattereri TaxID=42514 RepID=A0AAR2JSF3_PYGNA|nr:zinc finger protein 436-like isoform X1 [Pygocentrus nattereri]